MRMTNPRSRVAHHIGKYDTLLEIVKRKLAGLDMWWERKEPWQTPSCRVKLWGKITRKTSNTVVGRCEGMDHEEGQQYSGRTM